MWNTKKYSSQHVINRSNACGTSYLTCPVREVLASNLDFLNSVEKSQLKTLLHRLVLFTQYKPTLTSKRYIQIITIQLNNIASSLCWLDTFYKFGHYNNDSWTLLALILDYHLSSTYVLPPLLSDNTSRGSYLNTWGLLLFDLNFRTIKLIWHKRVKNQKRRKNRTTKERQLKLVKDQEIRITYISQEPAIGVDKLVIPQIPVLA